VQASPIDVAAVVRVSFVIDERNGLSGIGPWRVQRSVIFGAGLRNRADRRPDERNVPFARCPGIANRSPWNTGASTTLIPGFVAGGAVERIASQPWRLSATISFFSRYARKE
jgi:hypothetical protein